MIETKEIIQALKCCHNLDECDDCEYNELGGFCEELLKRDAAERLEELDAELEKRTINDRPYEWISVEDRLPKLRKNVIGVNKETGRSEPYYFIEYGAVKANVTHWMYFPTPPKPKEPTFKDVFLEKFPKASSICFKDYCPKSIFEAVKCPLPKFCAETDKKQCWNQPYFEEEGEGDA